MALQPSQLSLYGRLHSVSSASIRIAASLKQVPLKFHSLRESPVLKDYRRPRKLPHASELALLASYHNGQSLVLTQPLNILDFLEESYPGRRTLIPSVTDMAARCKVKDLAALIFCGIEPHQDWRVLSGLDRLEQDPIAWARSFLAQGMKAFESRAEKSAGIYSVGDVVSIADIGLVTMIQAAYRYGTFFDRSEDPAGTTRFPTVERIVKECEKLPSFTNAGVPK